MKSVYTLLLIALLPLSLIAQSQRFEPVSQIIFEKHMEAIQIKENPSKRIEQALIFANSEHYTCKQIQEMSFMLPNDKVKLQYSLQAYENVVDPKNYYSILDSYESLSTAFRFVDAIKIKPRPKPIANNSEIILGKEPVNIVSLLRFPDIKNYEGRTNSTCNKPITEKEFNSLKEQIRNVNSPQGKLNNGLLLMEKYCLSVEQVMKLSRLFEDEHMQYKLFAGSYDYIYDVDNFLFVNQLLKSKYYQNKIIMLNDPPLRDKPHPVIDSLTTENEPSPAVEYIKKDNGICRVDERELNEIISVLKEDDSESTRINSAQKIIKLKKCFRTEQIIRTLKCFKYESTKLDMAKFAFPYVIDKTNYYKVREIFDISSNKEDLNNFIDMQ
jgi:hypothetical protein